MHFNKGKAYGRQGKAPKRLSFNIVDYYYSLIRWPVNNNTDNIFPWGLDISINKDSATSISSKLKSARILKSRLSEIYNPTPPPVLFGRCLWIKLKPSMSTEWE